MRSPGILIVALASIAQTAAAAPALYHCEFKTVSDRTAASQPEKKPLVKDYVYDPAAGGRRH